MDLPEAIRIGASMTPIALFEMFYMNLQGKMGTCALGAAWVGVHGLPPDLVGRYEALAEDFPSIVMPYPGTMQEELNVEAKQVGIMNQLRGFYGERQGQIGDAIVFMNDILKWPRERIADFLQDHGVI